MLLKKLIKNCPKNIENQKIKGLSQDTRSLKKGNLFFALKGKKFDGEKFIKKAIAKGAKAVITSNNKIKNIKNIIIKVDSVKDSLMFATKVAGISTTRLGAANSIPTKKEIDNY